MRYDVEVTETRMLSVPVEAESAEEALRLAQAMYGGGEIHLEANSGASVTGRGECGNAQLVFGHWEA